MPRTYDAMGRTEDLAAAMVSIIDRDGVRALSLRRTCQVSGTSPASALHHFGGWARLRTLGAQFTWKWRQESIRDRVAEEGVVGFLPHDDQDLAEARAWLGWQEIGRCDDVIGAVVSDARDDRLALVARGTGYELDRPALLGLDAAIDGLVTATCARTDALHRHEAARVLERLVAVLASDARARVASTPPAPSRAVARGDAPHPPLNRGV